MIKKHTVWQIGPPGNNETALLRNVVTALRPVAKKITLEQYRGGRTNLIKQQLIWAGYKSGNCVYTNMPLRKKGKGKILHNQIINEFINMVNVWLDKRENQFGKHDFSNHEWLFDVHWYKDQKGKDYMPCSLPLVAEIELGKQRETKDTKARIVEFSAVKFDFQKLLVSNANNMVMVFTCTDFSRYVKRENGLDDYFMQALKYYRNIQNQKANFLLVCYSKEKMYWKYISCG